MNYILFNKCVSAGRTLLTVLVFAGLAVFFTGCPIEQDASTDISELPAQFAGEFRLYGKTLDGEDFDWESLRGKYVLVKFTASWCPPCKAEIPGMREAYEKYRDKGFEIVSVYIREDDNKDIKRIVEQEKLSWIIISEPLTKAAGLSPQGNHFGIEGVPTMFIVDKEGDIHAVNTRGPVLQRELQKLFGE